MKRMPSYLHPDLESHRFGFVGNETFHFYGIIKWHCLQVQWEEDNLFMPKEGSFGGTGFNSLYISSKKFSG